MDDLVNAFREWMEPPEVRALALIVGSLVVARIVDWLACNTLKRLASGTRTDIDDRLIQLLHRPIFLSVVLFGLYLAGRQFAMTDTYVRLAEGVIKSLALLTWTVALLRMGGEAFRGAGRLTWVDPRTIPLFENLTKIVLIGGAVYLFLSVWQLDVKPWLASAGIAGLALGFAAKDSLGNIFGGLSIIIDAPYKIGDFVNLDGGERGQVTQIGLRSTRILTRDDIEITVPNAIIANSKIVNESGGRWERSRLAVSVGVAYGSDIDQVRELLYRTALATENVLHDPEPRIRFAEMGDSALVFKILCWIEEPVLRGITIDALNTGVYKALNAAGITIPFPQRDVHIHGVPPAIVRDAPGPG